MQRINKKQIACREKRQQGEQMQEEEYLLCAFLYLSFMNTWKHYLWKKLNKTIHRLVSRG